jgi:hypothetical protein
MEVGSMEGRMEAFMVVAVADARHSTLAMLGNHSQG